MPWLMFFNPWLLLGTLLVGVPILIHLLTRRRHRRLAWAAMDFLIQADRQTRRRVRLENLLLLLLRCLIVLLLALLVARPWWQPPGGARTWANQPREHLVILDDSPSMGTRQGAITVFDAARTALGEFMRELAGTASADRRDGAWAAAASQDVLTLLLASRPQDPLIDHQRVSVAAVQSWLQQLDELSPADQPAAYSELFRAMKRRWDGQEEALPRTLYVVSDFREGDWSMNQDALGSPLAGPLETLAERVQEIVFVIQGEDHPANLAVSDLSFSQAHPVVGVDVQVQVSVVNHGPAPVRDVPLTLVVDNVPPRRAMIDQLAPGQSITLPFTLIFSRPQPCRILAQLPPDLLACDNQRRLAAWVTVGMPILLVQGTATPAGIGETGGTGGRSDAFFLERALQPQGPIASGNQVQTVYEARLETLDLDRFQLIFLCNLQGLSPAQTQALERWTSAGGTLVGFLGDQVDANLYNQRLYRNGQGLLPGLLLQVRGLTTWEQFRTLEVRQPAHPVLRVFTGTQNPFLSQVKVFRHWQLLVPQEQQQDPDAIPSAWPAQAGPSSISPQVLLSLRDAEQWPLLVEQGFGRGRTLWFTTSADTNWTNWPGDPSFVVMLLELASQLARPAAGMNLQVGEPILYSLDPGHHRLETELTPPGGGPRRIPATASASGAPTMLVRHEATDELGFYDMTLTALDGTREVLPFAVNLPPRESNLARAELPLWQRRLGEKLRLQTGSMQRGAAGPWAGKMELWRPIVLLLVLTLMVEQALAWTIGRRR